VFLWRLKQQMRCYMSANLLEPFAVAASLSEMLLRVDSVCKVTGLSVPTIYRLMSKDDFPRPVKLTSYARAWKLSEVMAWIDSRPEGMPAPQSASATVPRPSPRAAMTRHAYPPTPRRQSYIIEVTRRDRSNKLRCQT
jgi:prophage regulatory protein